MMQVYLQRSGRGGEDLINAFSNRLHHHQTREEVICRLFNSKLRYLRYFFKIINKYHCNNIYMIDCYKL